MGQEFTHRPVLLDECIENLNIRPDGVYLDGTLGRAGHSREIAKRLTGGRLICWTGTTPLWRRRGSAWPRGWTG